MNVNLELPTPALTPSGAGLESFKILRHRKVQGRLVVQFMDHEGNKVRIGIDPLTLQLLARASLEAM